MVVLAADSGSAPARSGGSAPPHPFPADEKGDGEWPSEDLRRTIDDIDSGRIETEDYPSARAYLEHLNSASDE